MPSLTSPLAQVLIALFGAALMLLFALLAPGPLLLMLPAMVALLLGLAVYQFPLAIVVGLVMIYGLGVDIQLDGGMLASAGGNAAAALGSAVVKVVPFALAAVLLLRYGPTNAINWPFLAYTAIAAISIVVLPMGRIGTTGDMIRSFIGSTAPFVLGFCLAPKRIWTWIIRGATVVPLISAFGSLFTHLAGLYPAIDQLGRFQGMHSAPFLAGFCETAIFAATLEYMRGFRPIWLIIAGLDLAVLLATQARMPLATVVIFLGIVFFFSNRHIFPLRRKVDLVMGGGVPGLLLLSPVIAYAMQRFISQGTDTSGRDLMWPYFLDAIENRPLFGYGLGAGKLLVDPDDPLIKLLGTTAAHNEYLRLSIDGGIIGCAAIFLSIIAWMWWGSRSLGARERLVLRAALLGFLLHSGFDNTLIASTSVMLFCVIGAILARGRAEVQAARHGRRHSSSGSASAGAYAWRPARTG
ncbi:O-antigen ligase family protein [Belnapia sp. T18]|uniref:O-antigen ligase family protein n=1 Tax=Belnapia arida TaxID=2804533 RepID=A0ABS1U565_9PROT|nr:O-antigen ligase family protein [Belnapia arida]MBL6079835.1 O-antigen ligase family protein [Belnapia arida]